MSKTTSQNSSHTGAVSNNYTVRQGDTLSKLAVNFNTSVDELVKSNDISNPDHIQVGQKITY